MLPSIFLLLALMAAGEKGGPSDIPEGPSLCATAPGGPVLALVDGKVLERPPSDSRRHILEAFLPVVVSPAVVATSLACEGERAAVGVIESAGSRKGKIVLFEKVEAGQGNRSRWTVAGEIATGLVPRHLLLHNGRLAALFEDRRGSLSLGFLDASSRAKMPNPHSFQTNPASLAVSPDGGSFLVAVGQDLRTFTVKDGATRTIFSFPEPVGVVESRPGIPQVLVNQGNAVVAVDPNDKPEKGALPVRARVELSAAPVEIVWVGDGRIAVARVPEEGNGSHLYFLNGADLSILDQREVSARAMASAAPGSITWLASGHGDSGDAVIEEAIAPELWARAVPPPSTPFAPDEPEAQVVAIPGEPEHAARPGAEVRPPFPTMVSPPNQQPGPNAPPPAATPPTATPAPAPSPTDTSSTTPVPPPAQQPAPNAPPPTAAPPPAVTPPTATRIPAPPPTATPSTTPVPPPTQQPAQNTPRPSAPPPAPATSPPTSSVPSAPQPQASGPPPAAGETPSGAIPPSQSPTAPAPPEPGSPSSKPIGVPSPTSPTTLPPTSASPPTSPQAASGVSGQNAQERPSGDATGDPSGASARQVDSPVAHPQARAAGTIQGTITGRADLVEEIVILGPDSALKQLARVKPSKGQGTATFSISGVPPGHYHVIPMGKGGASLKTRPALATVSVTGEMGAQADFTIEGAL